MAEEEIRQRYEAMEKEREVELRLIIVESETDAQEILQQESTGGFRQLAMSHSLHKSTAPMGGALEVFYSQAHTDLSAQIHKCAEGRSILCPHPSPPAANTASIRSLTSAKSVILRFTLRYRLS